MQTTRKKMIARMLGLTYAPHHTYTNILVTESPTLTLNLKYSFRKESVTGGVLRALGIVKDRYLPYDSPET